MNGLSVDTGTGKQWDFSKHSNLRKAKYTCVLQTNFKLYRPVLWTTPESYSSKHRAWRKVTSKSLCICLCVGVCKWGFLEIRSWDQNAGHKTGTQKHMVSIGYGQLLFLLCNYPQTSQKTKLCSTPGKHTLNLMATFSLKMCFSWDGFFRFCKVSAYNMLWFERVIGPASTQQTENPLNA